jgi:hypothetical protein
MKRLAILLLSFPALALAAALAPAARAGEDVEICYHYGCARRAGVHFSDDDLKRIQAEFAAAGDAAAERAAIASAMALMYLTAAAQTPIWQDRGLNIDDEEAEGRMDCIDHSTNTTTLLHLAQDQGWLKHHDVGPRVRRGRFLIFEHWSARVVERESREEFAVDTWFLDPGQPATIYPLRQWLDGAYPPGREPIRWN